MESKMAAMWHSTGSSMGLNMKQIIYLIFSVVLFFSVPLKAEEKIKNSPQIPNSVLINSESFVGFKNITFFLNTPCSSPKHCKEIETFAAAVLKKAGAVYMKKFSVETVGKEREDLKDPYLIYDISRMEGNAKGIPTFAVSMRFEAPVVIEKNKAYSRAILWYSNLYITLDNPTDVKGAIAQTLPQLIQDFNSLFQKANPNQSPIFYFVE